MGDVTREMGVGVSVTGSGNVRGRWRKVILDGGALSSAVRKLRKMVQQRCSTGAKGESNASGPAVSGWMSQTVL